MKIVKKENFQEQVKMLTSLVDETVDGARLDMEKMRKTLTDPEKIKILDTVGIYIDTLHDCFKKLVDIPLPEGGVLVGNVIIASASLVSTLIYLFKSGPFHTLLFTLRAMRKINQIVEMPEAIASALYHKEEKEVMAKLPGETAPSDPVPNGVIFQFKK